MKDDLRTLLRESGSNDAHTGGAALKVLIVDDEPTVHDITALVLKNFNYRGYGLELYSAYSASEAREMLASRGPFALILLDVIMETDDAGLKLVRYIREELGDHAVRIILRTGQPGMVPQRQVMRDYEIDDYKEKSELTSERFDAAVTASVRTYLSFNRLDRLRQGLTRVLDAVIDAQSGIADLNYSSRILNHIESVMNRGTGNESGSMLVSREESGDRIVAGHGRLEEMTGRGLENLENPELEEMIREALDTGSTRPDRHHIMTTLPAGDGGRYLAYFEDLKEFGDTERYLVESYASHVGIVLETRQASRELLDAQKELIATLGEVIESRSGESGPHVHRVSELVGLIAGYRGFTPEKTALLTFAAPLHDIGKVGIPENILMKPGKLTEAEYETIKTHPEMGYSILKDSSRPVIRTAAVLCLEHHERWDGRGYPRGIAGDRISIEARICSAADVLDALRSRRAYREAFPLDEAMDIIREGRGTQFDPGIVDILLGHRDEVDRIYASLPD